MQTVDSDFAGLGRVICASAAKKTLDRRGYSEVVTVSGDTDA